MERWPDSYGLFIIERARKHRRLHLRVRVCRVFAMNSEYVPGHHVAWLMRAEWRRRRRVRKLHSVRVRRVVVDRTLLHADENHDERRIRTLHEEREIQYLGHPRKAGTAHRGKQQYGVHDFETWLGKHTER
jgi:hypothetical protein